MYDDKIHLQFYYLLTYQLLVWPKKSRFESLYTLNTTFAILKSPSHGREMVVDFTKEMMDRRLKEEYNDDKTTSHSPLIEAICKQEESWENAKLVLKKGFEKFRDTCIAQTLAHITHSPCFVVKKFTNYHS
jgi:hypothetical protein